MIPLLALAAAGLLIDDAVSRSPSPRHRAWANVSTYYGDGDYPPDANRGGEQGIVAFTMDVDEHGRVSACRITSSSGSPTLDDATCRIARDRVRFTPARDRRGRPVPDRVSTRVNWVLPEPDLSVRARANLASYLSDADYPIEAIMRGEEGTVGYQLGIGPDGLVSDCVVTSSSGSTALDESTCRIMQERARFTPARDDRGNPVADTLKARIRWVVPSDEPDIGQGSGTDLTEFLAGTDYPPEALRGRKQGRVGVRLIVSAEGRATQCAVTMSSASAVLDARTCEILRERAHFNVIRNAAEPAAPSMIQGFVRWELPSPG